jgi:hypothetical protein
MWPGWPDSTSVISGQCNNGQCNIGQAAANGIVRFVNRPAGMLHKTAEIIGRWARARGFGPEPVESAMLLFRCGRSQATIIRGRQHFWPSWTPRTAMTDSS